MKLLHKSLKRNLNLTFFNELCDVNILCIIHVHPQVNTMFMGTIDWFFIYIIKIPYNVQL